MKKSMTCGCGCKGIPKMSGSRFLSGHYTRIHPQGFLLSDLKTRQKNGRKSRVTYLKRRKMKPTFCKCGCGKYTKSINKFINGHNKGMLGKHQTEESNEKRRFAVSGSKHPSFGKVGYNKGRKMPHREESKIKISKGMLLAEIKRTDEFKENQRQNMLNGQAVYATSCCKSPSKPQVSLHDYLKNIYLTAELNYPVKMWDGKYYSLDIAIPELKIDYEFDGEYWHSDDCKHNPDAEVKDFFRDENLIERGWTVVRIKGEKELKQVMEAK